MATDIRATTNQAPPLVDHNTVTSDVALVEAVTRHASAAAVEDLAEIGALASTEEAREHGMLANRNEPELVPYDRYGGRVDEVRFHPSWHWLMERGVGFGLQAAPWTSDDPHAHVRRAAGFFAWSQTVNSKSLAISFFSISKRFPTFQNAVFIYFCCTTSAIYVNFFNNVFDRGKFFRRRKNSSHNNLYNYGK